MSRRRWPGTWRKQAGRRRSRPRCARRRRWRCAPTRWRCLGQEKDLERLDRGAAAPGGAAGAAGGADASTSTRARERERARLEAATTALEDDGRDAGGGGATRGRAAAARRWRSPTRSTARRRADDAARWRRRRRRSGGRTRAQTLERLLADRAAGRGAGGALEQHHRRGCWRAARRCATQVVELRDEAELAQAEAEARARAHGERQSALEERQARAGRARGASCARRAPRWRGWRRRCRSSSCAARRRRCAATSLEEQVADRYRDVVLAAVVYDYHLRPLFGDDRGDARRRSCAASSSAWARST